MIPLFKVFMSPQAAGGAGVVLDSGYIGEGQQVKTFEASLQNRIGNRHIACVNSGTSALHLAYRMLDDLPGDEILTCPLTCTATNWPALACGHKLRWVDVGEDSCAISVRDLGRKLSDRTKAIVVVHWGGMPVDLDAIAAMRDLLPHKPPIIEDAAHAIGASYHGAPVGNHGNLTAFSFQAIKHVTSIDGGALACPTKETLDRVKLLRWYGIDRDGPRTDFRCEQDIAEWGYKFHMNDVCAHVGNCNLQFLDWILLQHRTNAMIYHDYLRGIPGLRIARKMPYSLSSYWLFTIFAERRDELQAMLASKGIMSSRVHARNDKHACVQKFRETLPNLDRTEAEMLCIPVGWWVTPEEVKMISETIRGGW